MVHSGGTCPEFDTHTIGVSFCNEPTGCFPECCEMSHKRKHTSCSLKDKLEVLQRLDNGERAAKLSLEFGVGRTTINDWKKNRLKIEEFCATTTQDVLVKRQTSRASAFEEVNKALYLWFIQEQEKGTHLNGTIIQNKALQLNSLLEGDASFTADSGWFHRWKKRHGVCLGATVEVKIEPDQNDEFECKVEFQNVLPPSDIKYSNDSFSGGAVDSLLETSDSANTASEDIDSSDVETNPISHVKGAAALEVALRYIQQHSMATPTDVMFLERWRNIAASSVFSSLHHSQLSEYIVNNKDL